MNRRVCRLIHHCGTPILVGLDNDRAALVARVDEQPLTALGEVYALTAGRRTYRLHHGALDRRDRWNIPDHPPSHGTPVHAEHWCADPLPAEWCLPPLPTPAPAILTDEIGF